MQDSQSVTWRTCKISTVAPWAVETGSAPSGDRVITGRRLQTVRWSYLGKSSGHAVIQLG
jgi:hypothetical protein